MRLIIVRHGETQWNQVQRLQGASQTQLTTRGQWQARQIAARLRRMQVDTVISSPLQRCKDTATPIAKSGHHPLYLDAALAEMHFGCWEGKTFDEIAAEHPEQFALWRQHPDQMRASTDAETVPEVWARVAGLLDELLAQGDDKCHVLVTHTVPAKLIIASAIALPLSNIHAIRLDNASMSMVDWRQEQKVLRLMNDISHL